MRSRRPVRFALLAAALAALPLRTLADASDGIKLLQEGHLPEARAEFERSAAKGDTASQSMLTLFLWHGFDRPPERDKACQAAATPALAAESMAQAILARCHLAGTGVQKDWPKAHALARSSAQAGNNEGRFVFYLTVLSDPARSYFVDGKPDKSRYDALAARPIEARAAEVEAIDLLARAAQSGHRESQLQLAAYFFDTLGEGNRKKARALYSQIPGLPERFSKFRDTLAQADAIAGGSPLTVAILRDAQTAGVFAAMVAAYPPTAPKPDCKDIRLVSASPAGPIQNPVYLPHSHPWVQRSYLLNGHWEEDWRYNLCGKEVSVRMSFDADGMSGASFRSTQTARTVK